MRERKRKQRKESNKQAKKYMLRFTYIRLRCVSVLRCLNGKHTNIQSIYTYISAYILIWNLLIKWEKNMMMMMMLMHTRITTTPTTSKNSYGRTYRGIERYRVACFACSCSQKTHTYTYSHRHTKIEAREKREKRSLVHRKAHKLTHTSFARSLFLPNVVVCVDDNDDDDDCAVDIYRNWRVALKNEATDRISLHVYIYIEREDIYRYLPSICDLLALASTLSRARAHFSHSHTLTSLNIRQTINFVDVSCNTYQQQQ